MTVSVKNKLSRTTSRTRLQIEAALLYILPEPFTVGGLAALYLTPDKQTRLPYDNGNIYQTLSICCAPNQIMFNILYHISYLQEQSAGEALSWRVVNALLSSSLQVGPLHWRQTQAPLSLVCGNCKSEGHSQG